MKNGDDGREFGEYRRVGYTDWTMVSSSLELEGCENPHESVTVRCFLMIQDEGKPPALSIATRMAANWT